jgi:predicted lipoprotein with Yx(FWY)xxD motif
VTAMKRTALLLLIVLLVLAGCGGDDGGSDSGSRGAERSAAENATGDGTTGKTDAGAEREGAAQATGTTVTLADSEFGRMLFDSKEQAIYIFERDRQNESNCYGECAEAWPPVFTKGKPRAGKGVDKSLLGTTKRRDGKLQVTYAGKPLYYYAHEGPGEVKCHNVNLNGGFWWAVGADGERLQ